MFKINIYQPENEKEWNEFVDNSKNGTFLFNRQYMEYHKDKFCDFSLMIRLLNGNIYAILPGNIVDNDFFSHQGLTYGGLILGKKATVCGCIEAFKEINSFLKSRDINSVTYKPTPYFYHNLPAEEDLYALFKVCNANIIDRKISSVIDYNNIIRFGRGRREGIRKADKAGVIIKPSEDFDGFWEVLENNLNNKYNAKPVHSLKEIKALKTMFINNIQLFVAVKNNKIIAGTVLYKTNNVLHTQYISATQEGKELGAIDKIFDVIINNTNNDVKFFDFGTSQDNNVYGVNENLLFQKESFGARGVCYDTYKWYI